MPFTDHRRTEALKRSLGERILVLDGAMGTALQSLGLTADDFGGVAYEGCNEHLVLTKPAAIAGIHREYLEAGADIVETNSFGSTPLVLAEYDLAEKAREISRRSAQIARDVADSIATVGQPRFVAGSMGPTTKSISVTGGVTWDALAESYAVQASGLIEGGVDVLLVETSQDSLNVKAALEGIDRAIREAGIEVPVAVQGTVEAMGTLLGGQDVEAFYTSLHHRDLLWMGLNCATGPRFMTDHIRSLARICRFPVACVPNAGLPDEDGHYNETPEMMESTLRRFVEEGWVNLIGGCCGTDASHVAHLANLSKSAVPRLLPDPRETRVSGLETLLIDEDTRPVLVGERTNVLGSRLFKRLVAEAKWEEAAEIGRRQVRNGAHCLDVCLQDPDRDEIDDVTTFLEVLTRKVKAPIVLDSTDSRVLEEGLKRTPGKSIINSINLEDGEERFASVVPLAKRYGAAIVVGCIDDDKEQAQAITRNRKVEIARRSHKILVEKYGVPEEDIIFDPLVFPAGTGDENYIGSAVETIEGIRAIKEVLPGCKTVLGISNVSFGLPAAGREVLNSVMLFHCVQAGLDMAIVNSERLERYATLSPEDIAVCENLLWSAGEDPIAAFASHFRTRTPSATLDHRATLSLDERLAWNIIEGSKEGLFDDLDVALKDRKALDIVNGPLMTGMDEVGRLFNDNTMIVAEVLQSAQAMKAAVGHLEPYMEKEDKVLKGKVLLATVKGDVHDIGKNLVEIILSNNGFHVVNLGIKVPPQDLILGCREHDPDVIGLSGLLVKSAQMMVETAQDLREAGVNCPMLVGGAALSNRFARLRISPAYGGLVAYAQDAMDGLGLANRIQDEDERALLVTELDRVASTMNSGSHRPDPEMGSISTERSLSVGRDVPIPNPPDLKSHVLYGHDMAEIFEYINPMMLYVRHLGYKGRFAEALALGEAKAVELRGQVRRVEDVMLARDDIRADAVFRFFRACSDGQELLLYAGDTDEPSERFYFGRQREGDGLSLVDYVAERSSGRQDYIAMFATTVGPGVRDLADEFKHRGDYLDSHILQALALESAEAFAELLHQQLRAAWGFPDPTGITKEDLFKAHYVGRRYSFGYPACPRLEDQEQLFRLLGVEHAIGVALTEGHMMDPEGSVSALVIHHPDAKYFGLSPGDIADLDRAIAGG